MNKYEVPSDIELETVDSSSSKLSKLHFKNITANSKTF